MITNKLNIIKYLSVTSVLLLLVISVTGCNEEAAPTEDSSPGELFKVTHHVSVGGADVCEALGEPTGCDANFSLVANEKNGIVTGQWQDTFSGGGNGIHVAIDCMKIIGNAAIVGGVITHGSSGDVDLTGQYAMTMVVDNGTSANDPPDEISFSYFNPNWDCQTVQSINPDFFTLLELAHGQVKVR